MATVLRVPPQMEERREGVPIAKPYPSYGKVRIPETGAVVGTGWLPDIPDLRDYTDETPEIAEAIEKLGIAKAKKLKAGLPGRVDLRTFCSDIENQGQLGSCTANAAVGIVEYFERKAFGRYIDGSRLFVYKTTRELMGLVGDTGAYLRTTMGALVFFGLPPEDYWPYTDNQEPGTSGERTFDDEPTTFVYELADNYEAIKYVCHDPFGANTTPPTLLNNVKTYLAAQIPSMFGFYVFPSFNQADVKGGIPFPSPGERAVAGHAVVAVGYDDSIKIKNLNSNQDTTGAFLIRNSWGTAWGDRGYGWLPYQYVLSQFAEDFWSLLKLEWVETGKFGL